jgi:DNA-binding PadR family transcriptional regulator
MTPVRDVDVALPPHWFQILLALADRDLHGLGIMNEVLERTSGRMRLWPAMLYRNLGRLADEGLVTEIRAPRNAEAGGGRPRYYRITALGRRACGAEARRLAGFVAAARQKKLLPPHRAQDAPGGPRLLHPVAHNTRGGGPGC